MAFAGRLASTAFAVGRLALAPAVRKQSVLALPPGATKRGHFALERK